MTSGGGIDKGNCTRDEVGNVAFILVPVCLHYFDIQLTDNFRIYNLQFTRIYKDYKEGRITRIFVIALNVLIKESIKFRLYVKCWTVDRKKKIRIIN